MNAYVYTHLSSRAGGLATADHDAIGCRSAVANALGDIHAPMVIHAGKLGPWRDTEHGTRVADFLVDDVPVGRFTSWPVEEPVEAEA